MAYKSPCKACNHPHSGGICQQHIVENGTIRLKPYSQSLWGVQGGYVKDYSYAQYDGTTAERTTFQPFQIGRDEAFEYAQDTECHCRFYVPSDNLEFLEWKYEASGK